jgi:glycosyltransferase involved in cell wall biosynthesis
VKICVLNVLHGPYDKRVFQKVGRSLAAAGHEVVSICPYAGPLEDGAHGIRFVAIPPVWSMANRLRAVLRLVRLGRRERAEVYLAPEPESWVAALLIKFAQGGKVVFDMHEHVPTEFAKFFPRPAQGLVEWLTVRFMRLFARYTDLIILTRDSFEQPWRGLSTPRVTVINTNHLQPPCRAVPGQIRAQYGTSPTIIHQGLFGDVRGSYQLLDAMKLLVREIPNIRCIVLGEYVYGNEAVYREAIWQAGLQDHIHLLGVVSYEAVPAYIAAAQVGLILFQPGLRNHTLAMPHKLFDYMREIRPVVAPAFAVEVAHIVNESGCGLLVDVTDPRAIAAAVLRLLRDPDEAARLGQNGRRAVEQKYNWQADERRLLSAIAALDRK